MLMLVIMLSFGITILSGAAELRQGSEVKTASTTTGYDDGYDDYYGSEPPGGHGLIWIPISLVFGAIVASAMNGSEKASMKTVREQTKANYYFKQGGLNLNVNQNIFLYKRTERTPLNQDPNMGGMGPGQMNPQTGVRTGMPNQTVSRMPQSGVSGNPYQPMTPSQTRSPYQPGTPSQTRSPYQTSTQSPYQQHSNVQTQSPRSPYQSSTPSRPSSSIQSNPSSGSRSSSMNHSPSGASSRPVSSSPSHPSNSSRPASSSSSRPSSSSSRPSSSSSSRSTSSSPSRSSTPTRTATPPRPSSSSTANRRPSGGPKR